MSDLNQNRWAVAKHIRWLQSTQISKVNSGMCHHISCNLLIQFPPRQTYEQMSLAIARQADRIWIVNVGDLKPYELDIEFFVTLGWDASKWTPFNLDGYVSSWAKREFDLNDSDSEEVAGIIANVTRFNARRKPELLNSTTYSLTNYRE